MAKGDITIFENAGASKMGGTIKKFVAAGTTASINAGEPVDRVALTTATVKAMPNAATPGTDFVVGVALSNSNETATVAGTVDVIPAIPGQIFLCAPKVPASWNTQALYNALCGKRVQFDLTGGVYTILTTDLTQNMCIVEWLDVGRYPGMVAFSFNTKAVDSNI